MDIILTDPTKRFIEQLGLVAEAEGLPRIAGMIMGLMLAVDRPYSFEALKTILKVSHGSASTNARLLESLGVIERTTALGDRRTYFQLTNDPYGRLLAGSLERMRRTRAIVEKGLDELENGEAGGGSHRLKEMAAFYALAIQTTESTIESWRTRRST